MTEHTENEHSAVKAALSPSKPSAAESAKGYVRPHRDAVEHVVNGKHCPVTILRSDVADFHARQPGVLSTLVCSRCNQKFPTTDFVWHGTDEVVGS
jgi:hypothetical protein